MIRGRFNHVTRCDRAIDICNLLLIASQIYFPYYVFTQLVLHQKPSVLSLVHVKPSPAKKYW